MALIEVAELIKTYAEDRVATRALRGVTFSIEQGEFVAFMGASGSGKSTLLHILGFLDRPTSGRYTFDGHRLDDYSEVELAAIRNRTMGFVFQAFHLLPHRTVFDNVLLPLQYSTLPRRQQTARVEAALAQVGLTDRQYHRPNQLSGGEKQRVAIARALVNQPLVIFADEPTGNLDSVTGQNVMETIDDLHERGHTVVLITHETPTAAFAERTIELKDGQVVRDERRIARAHERYHK